MDDWVPVDMELPFLKSSEPIGLHEKNSITTEGV